MILIDSNIPMYLVGAPHRHKTDAQQILERHVMAGDRLVADAEAFQEILHRYAAIGRLADVQPAYTALLDVVDEVLPVDLDAVQRAKEILLATTGLSARDVLHIAMMKQHRIERIMSFDHGFDLYPGITRICA